MTAVTIQKGKAEFVKWNRNGKIIPICIAKHNVDLSSGCVARVDNSLLDIVMENNGKYPDPEEVKRKGMFKGNACEYCYALRHNYRAITPFEVNDTTKKSFEVHQPDILRIGKNAEPGHIYYRDVLKQLLRMGGKFGSRPLIFSKALEYDRFLGETIREQDGVINYGICNDSLEKGLVSQGHTNQARIDAAVEYYANGVPASLTLVYDVTDSFDANSERGFAIKEALEAHDKYKVPLRIIPMRIASANLAMKVTGKGWSSLTENRNFFDTFGGSDENSSEPLYTSRGNNELIPTVAHQDTLDLLDSGVGACTSIGKLEHCDYCKMNSGKISFPVSELAKVDYTSTRLQNGRYSKKKEHGGQQKLF